MHLYPLYLTTGVGIYIIRSMNERNLIELPRPQPSHSYALVDTGYSSNNRFQMFCCSNTSSPSGSFTYPTGRVSSNDHWQAQVRIYTGSHGNAGCYRFSYRYRDDFSLSSYSGIHTCRIADSRGNYLNINIGLYDETFRSKCVSRNGHACMRLVYYFSSSSFH